MALGTSLGIIGTGLTFGGLFLALGWKADDLISKQAREDLTEYLRSFKPHRAIKTVYIWPRIFREFFDIVFGKEHLSLKCFFRSSIASILAFSICLIIMYLLIKSSLAEGDTVMLLSLDDYDASNAIKYYAVLGILVLLFGAIFNVFVDYLSLLETRYVIGRIEQTESAIGQLGWVVFDLFATGLIFLLYSFLIAFFVRLDIDKPVDLRVFAESFYNSTIALPIENNAQGTLRAAFWTTFITSLWVWLYFVAQMLTRFVVPLYKSIKFLKYLLPINSHPLRAICTVMAIIACIGVWITSMLG